MRYSERLIEWGVVVSLMLIPLCSSTQFFFAATFVQSILFFVLATTLLVVVLSRYVLRDVMYHAPVIALGTFVLALVIASFFGEDMARSMWSTFERMWGAVTHVAVFGFVIALSVVFRGEARIQRLLNYLSMSVCAVSVYALGAWIIQGFPSRIGGSIGNAAFLASFLLLGLFLLIVHRGMYDNVSLHRQWLWWGAMLLAICTLVLTGTRGAWLGAFAGGGTLLVLILSGGARDAWGFRRITLLRCAKMSMVGGVILVLVLLFSRSYFRESNITTLRRLGDISFESRAVSGRLLNWGVAWEGIQERPIFGWGPEQYHLLYDKYYNPKLYNIEPWVDRAHNNYLDVAAVSGIIGFLAYASVLGAGLYGAWKLRAQHWAMGNALIAGIVAYGVNALFLFDTLWTWVWLLLLVTIPYLMRTTEKPRIVASTTMYVRAVVLGVGGCVVLWYGVLMPALANAYGKYAYDALAQGNDAVAYEAYTKAISFGSYGDVDIDRSLAEYVFDFVRHGGKRDPVSLIRANEHALEAMDRNILREPENGKWWLWAGQLASLHSTLTDTNKDVMLGRSVAYLQGAVIRMPNRAQVLLELAQVYRVQGDVVSMRDALNRAISIWPAFPLPHANAATQYIYVGDRINEEKEIAWLRQNSWTRKDVKEEEDLHSPDRDMALMRDAYFNVARYRDAVHMQQEIVVREEQSYARNGDATGLVASLQVLAAIESRAGDRAGARVHALRVLDLDPTKRVEVEGFLRSIGY